MDTKNVLPNSYVPVVPVATQQNLVQKLPKKSIWELAQLWLDNAATHPAPRPGEPQHEANARIRREIEQMQQLGARKEFFVQKMTEEYWPRGLNLLQLAHLDCKALAENTGLHFWVSSTARDLWGAEVPLLLDPKDFLKKLAADLSRSFTCHIYVTQHPSIPVVVIRIAVYDVLPFTAKNVEARHSRPHVTSHKPFFVALPGNSPHVIHSPNVTVVGDAVLQLIESSILRTAQMVFLERPTALRGIKSLETMHVLKGCSRYANMLGVWTPYADDTVDISPLGSASKHPLMSSTPARYESPQERTEKLANVRFRGRAETPLPKRSQQRDTFASVAPLTYAEFTLREELPNGAESGVVLKLSGTDVFGGLHKLAATGHNKVLDPETIPGWLTGENGMSTGVVLKGVFTAQ